MLSYHASVLAARRAKVMRNHPTSASKGGSLSQPHVCEFDLALRGIGGASINWGDDKNYDDFCTDIDPDDAYDSPSPMVTQWPGDPLDSASSDEGMPISTYVKR